jgi:ferric iron reductase protein FhuF
MLATSSSQAKNLAPPLFFQLPIVETECVGMFMHNHLQIWCKKKCCKKYKEKGKKRCKKCPEKN